MLSTRLDKLSFQIHEAPSRETLTKLVAETDCPCVWNETFLRATSAAGSRIIALLIQRDRRLAALAVGTLDSRFLRSALMFPTYPRLLDGDLIVATAFWDGLQRYCHNRRIETVRLNSFEALEPQTPPLENLLSRRQRVEYLIDLRPTPDTLFKQFSPNHRRNINKALSYKPACRIGANEVDLKHHIMLLWHTLKRREMRKESLPSINRELYLKLIASGDGHLMQLVLEGEVLSSFLILTTPKRAFYFSGGTSEKGMKIGSSHCLMWLVMQDLRSRGIDKLSLGGVLDRDPKGLARFKPGFGAVEIPLVHYEYFTGRPLVRKVVNLARLIHRLPRLCLDSLGRGQLLKKEGSQWL